MVRLLFIFLLICSPVFAKTIPELNSNTTPTTSDLTYTVDVSDTTDGSSGTGKKATIAQVFKAANMTIDGTNVGVNSLAPGARLDVVGTVRATAFSGDGSGLTGVSGAVSDDAYGAGWDGDTTTPASKNSIYDKIETIATGSGGWTDGGTNVYVSTSTDKVGIGSTTPRAKVDVIGTAYIDDTLTVGGSSQIQFTTNGETISNTTDGYNDFSGGITTVGNIGVGTITASSRLTVSGTATATAFSGPLTGNVTGNASTATALAANGANCSAGSYPLGVDASGAVENCTVAGSDSGWTDGGTNIYNTATSDNVGIGTTTPTSKLTVAGAITTTGTTAGSLVLSEASANGSNTITISAPSAVTSDVTCTVEDDATPFDSCITAVTASGWTDGGTNVYTTTTTDTVGIGTTTPVLSTLSVVKQGTTNPLRISSSATQAGDYLTITSAGNIGIGTNSVGTKIYVKQTANTNLDGLLIANSGLTGSMRFWVDGSNNGRIDNTFSANTPILINGAGGGNVGIGTQTARGFLDFTAPSATTKPILMTTAGNLGIGTLSPSNNIDFGTTNAVQWPAQKSSSGTRYLCIDSVGVITSSASACSGT